MMLGVKRFGLCLLMVTGVLCGGLWQPGFAAADESLIPDLTTFQVITDLGPYRVNNDANGDDPRISFAVADGYLCDMTRHGVLCNAHNFPYPWMDDNEGLLGFHDRKTGNGSLLDPEVRFFNDFGLDSNLVAGMGLVKAGKPIPGYPALPPRSAVVLPLGSSTALHKGINYTACAYNVYHVFTCWEVEDQTRLSGDSQPKYVTVGFRLVPLEGSTAFKLP